MKNLDSISEKHRNFAPYNAGDISSIFLNIFAAQAVLYAYKKDLFAFLAPKGQTYPTLSLKDIAHHMGISLRATQAIVSVCCALNLITTHPHLGEHRFMLTTLAEAYLLKESAFWYGGVLEDLIENNFMTSLETLEAACETNKPQITSGNHFEAANHTPHIGTSFLKLMHAKSSAPASIWPSTIDLTPFKTMLDIGGGAGTHAIHACLHWPHLNAILFDLAFACHAASKFIARLGLENKITTRVGDMWHMPYPAADLHFYSDILHDWPLEKGRLLLEKSYTALPSGGCIIIHERLFHESKTAPLATATYNLMMLLWTEGQQLSQDELYHMLTKAGFVNMITYPTIDAWSITIGYKP